MLEMMTEQRSYKWSENGRRLKQAREATGLSQEKAGSQVGVSGHMVWFWEAGRSMPRADRLSSLATLYGVSVDWLLGQEKDGLTTEVNAIWEEAQQALTRAAGNLSEEDGAMIRDIIRTLLIRRRSKGE